MTGASQQTFNRETRHEIAPKTGGELVMRLLQAKGVDFVFGTTDGAMNDIQDAMVVVKPPKWIQGLHEFVSVNAASGYGLASGKAGVAMIGRIVGTLNAAGAGYCAYALSSPIVIIGSTNAPGAPIPNQLPEYHYFGDQFQPISMFLKWKTISSSLETLPDDIDKAFFLATSEHPGITYVAVRQDLMASRPGSSRVTNKESPAVSPIITDLETTEEVVSFLLKSDQPEVVTSKIGRRPQAVASLVSFAHTFGAAVREERSFMNYPVSDPFYLDALDVFGGYRPPELLKETDLLFSIEFGLIPQYTFEEGVSVVEMTSDPLFNHDVPMGGGDYGSTPVRALKRLVCDSGPMLDALVKLGEKRMTPDDRKEVEKRTEKISEMHEKALREWRTKGEGRTHLHQGSTTRSS
jgi:thiamine pyrophosphate-dependent acetolactate synthase large subunit-like protein